MKKITLILITLVYILKSQIIYSQTDKAAVTEHYIEVTGTAEILVTPNEFTFKIKLFERFDNKEKNTIDKQENRLKEELTNIGIDMQKDLTIVDLNSLLTNQKRKKDVIGSKDYHLKVYDITKIEKLQQIADKLELNKLDLINATHTDLIKFRKETKMEAVKSAKAKAEYMLEVIGEKVGKPILIQEIVDHADYQNYLSKSRMGELSSNSLITIEDNMKTGETLSFSKIQLKYNILARFEIK